MGFYEDFQKRLEERRKRNFDAVAQIFDEESRKNGDGRTLEEIFTGKRSTGAGPWKTETEDPRATQAMEIVAELQRETHDTEARDALMRGLAVYLRIVRHAVAGGSVGFVDTAGVTKKLKIRLREVVGGVSPATAEAGTVPSVAEIVAELVRDTTDDDKGDACLRALGMYRSIVRHVKSGGSVAFVSADGTSRKLKVSLRGAA